MVPHYRPIACWFFATATAILLVECRCKKDGYKSVATFTEVPLHQTCLLIGATLRYACLYNATLSDMHDGFILFRYACF